MAYKKTIWQGTFRDPQGNVTQEGTTLTSTKLNNIENGIEAAATKEELVVVNKQLAETDSQIVKTSQRMNREVLPQRKRKPIMTFIDDDGRKDVIAKWEGNLQAKGFPLTVALYTEKIGTDPTYMSWEDVARLKRDYGVEFVNHTHNHLHLGTLTEEQVHYQFKTASDILREKGLVPDIMVYPYGSMNEMVRRVSRDYFRASVSVIEKINFPPLETFQLNRITLAEGTNNTFEYYKQKIDETIAGNGWIIWKSHSQYPEFDATQIDIIKQIIDYARLQGVEILNMHDALDRMGNIIDIGDYPSRASASEYTIMDAEGKIHSKANSKDYLVTRYAASEAKTISVPITAFPLLTVTRDIILGATVAGFPEGKTGTLETFRPSSDAFAFQLYYINNSSVVYKRSWNTTTGAWNDFAAIGGSGGGTTTGGISIESAFNAFTNASLPEDFTQGKITYTRISSAHPTISEFPGGVAGVLVTSRLYPSATGSNYVWQEYHAYNGILYRRAFQGVAWGAWETVVTGMVFTTLLVPAVTVPANGYVDAAVAYAPVKNTDFIHASPQSGLANGLMYNVMCKASGTITVRYFNATTTEISAVARNFKFAIKAMV